MSYGKGFARVYNRRWAGFATRVAPLILDFYADTPKGHVNRTMLDLCCGTGQFALEALRRGYRVTGLDQSPFMLHHARETAESYLAGGQARFLQGDARRFTLDEPVGLAVSTFDSLNHLETEQELANCFAAVHSAVEEGGLFIFDLNTRAKLTQWTGIEVIDSEEMALIQRSLYVAEQEKAYVKISGFVAVDGGLYERFDETLSNTAFALDRVKALLRAAGWRDSYCARVQDLATPLSNPEAEERVFFVAHK